MLSLVKKNGLIFSMSLIIKVITNLYTLNKWIHLQKRKKISSEFLNKGYYIFNIKEKNILNSLSSKIIYKSSKILNKS